MMYSTQTQGNGAKYVINFSASSARALYAVQVLFDGADFTEYNWYGVICLEADGWTVEPSTQFPICVLVTCRTPQCPTEHIVHSKRQSQVESQKCSRLEWATLHRKSC